LPKDDINKHMAQTFVEEIEVGVFSMEHNKASGPDGVCN
jgi:hypothetical protein